MSEHTARPSRRRLDDEVQAVARLQPPSPLTALRHGLALGLHRAARAPELWRDVVTGRALRSPSTWLRGRAVQAVADHLSTGGPSSAEVARQILAAPDLYPSDLVASLRARRIRVPPMDPRRVREALGELSDVVSLGPHPRQIWPLMQVHDGSVDGRPVTVAVRRSGVELATQADAALAALLLDPLSRTMPMIGALHPLGFVHLTTRVALEQLDLRYEADAARRLDELLRESGCEDVHVLEPDPVLVTPSALVRPQLQYVPLGASGRPDLVDPQAALRALAILTVEAALRRGFFWADPAVERLGVDRAGHLVVTSVGAMGELSRQLRKAGIDFLKAFLSGDHSGQVEAMSRAGALSERTDRRLLVSELAQSQELTPGRLVFGGESALLEGLNTAIRLLLKHEVRPPLPVVLLMRALFALAHVARRIDPSGSGLAMAIVPLLQNFDQIAEDLDTQ